MTATTDLTAQIDASLAEERAIEYRIEQSLLTRLKSCPFCGGQARMSLGDGLGAVVTCQNCRAKSGRVQLRPGRSREQIMRRMAAKLVMAWNRRPE